MAGSNRIPASSLTQEVPLTVERVGIYARVSTRDQSPEMQLRDLRAYAAQARGFEAVEYVDTRLPRRKAEPSCTRPTHKRHPQAPPRRRSGMALRPLHQAFAARS